MGKKIRGLEGLEGLGVKGFRVFWGCRALSGLASLGVRGQVVCKTTTMSEQHNRATEHK